MKTLRLTVVTPHATVFDDAVDAVIAPLSDGWRGVLPGHASFVARLLRGEILFRVGDKERVIATIGGAISVDREGVTVLTGVAAVDCPLENLERAISEESQQLAALEREAEKHFDRVYRQMAHTFNHHRRRYS
ncbi:MAG: F0F1 ATP synthase subunit epsilon [Candidatus Binatia bacterium]